MVLIPGLPDDLGRECLVRVHHSRFSTLSSVCKAWKSELQSTEFRLYRKQTCNFQKLIVVAQRNSYEIGKPTNPIQLTLVEPETGDWWSCLPPLPDLLNVRDLLPFCEVFSCMSGFVLMVGLSDFPIKHYDINVYVFDFFSSAWRRGRNMPWSGIYPRFGGCTSDGDHMIYVAWDSFPEDDPIVKSRSIMVYDTTKDEWTTLTKITMSNLSEFDVAIFHHGKIHVMTQKISYAVRETEVAWRQFDVSTSQWDLSQQKFFRLPELLSSMCFDDNGECYWCGYDEVFSLRGSTWESIAKLPSNMCSPMFMTVSTSKLLVLGMYTTSWHHLSYVLDMKNHQWTRVKLPVESRHIYSACSLEI